MTPNDEKRIAAQLELFEVRHLELLLRIAVAVERLVDIVEREAGKKPPKK